MKLSLTLGLLLARLALAGTGLIDFGADDLGALPRGWTPGLTGYGASDWKVVRDPASHEKVLEQSAVGNFPWCVLDGPRLESGFVEAELMSVSGEQARDGGLVWRFHDNGEYYVARVNLLQDNITIYHFIDGKRRPLQSLRVVMAPGEWHRLRVDFSGRRFLARLDGRVVLKGEDDKLSGVGQLGLFTRADSRTRFRKFRYGDKAEFPGE